MECVPLSKNPTTFNISTAQAIPIAVASTGSVKQKFSYAWAGWLAFLLPVLVYLASMQRQVGFWDTGEMQTVPYILGIAHPTGFPAFVLAGWLFTHLFVFGSVAFRMTLLCVLIMSGTAWFIYRIITEQTGAPYIALCSAWLFAFGEVAWTRGTRTEVHALSTFFVAFFLFLLLRWYRTGSKRALVGSAFVWGLALSTHPLSILLVFGVVLFLLVRRHKFSGALLALCLFALLSGVSLYAYLPLRSHQVYVAGADRTLSLGIPPGRPFWDYDHPASRSGFLKLVTGSDFDVGEGIGAIFTPGTYLSKGGTYALAFWNEFGVLGILLFVAGAAITTQRDPPLAVGLFLCGFVAVPFALGFHAEADIGRYFLPSFVVSAVLIGVGAAEMDRLRGTPNGSPIFAAVRKWAVPLLVALAALGQLSAHRSIFQQRGEGGATAFLASVKRLTPPNAILVSPWLYATPLAYGIYVDHTLDDRIVETAWLSEDVSMIPRWMKERPVIVVGTQSARVPGAELREIAGSDPALYRLVGRPRK